MSVCDFWGSAVLCFEVHPFSIHCNQSEPTKQSNSQRGEVGDLVRLAVPVTECITGIVITLAGCLP
jgi:hypothetical protein